MVASIARLTLERVVIICLASTHTALRDPYRAQSVQTCLGANRISQRISPASPALFALTDARPLDWPMKSDPYDAHLSSSLLAT